MIWLPLISAVFGLNKVFGDENGQAPAWLVAVTGVIFRGMWTSYDKVFFRIFGDGERTHYKDEEEDAQERFVHVGSPIEYNGAAEKGMMSR